MSEKKRQEPTVTFVRPAPSRNGEIGDTLGLVLAIMACSALGCLAIAEAVELWLKLN
jgi:hypothetical protein